MLNLCGLVLIDFCHRKISKYFDKL